MPVNARRNCRLFSRLEPALAGWEQPGGGLGQQSGDPEGTRSLGQRSRRPAPTPSEVLLRTFAVLRLLGLGRGGLTLGVEQGGLGRCYRWFLPAQPFHRCKTFPTWLTPAVPEQ